MPSSNDEPAKQGPAERHPLDPGSKPSRPRDRSVSPEQRPPLPPRPSASLSFLAPSPKATSQSPHGERPRIRGGATTALSLTDVNTQSFHDGSRELHATTANRVVSRRSNSSKTSDAGDSSSVRSYMPNANLGEEVGSLFGGILGNAAHQPGLIDAALGGIEEENDLRDTPDYPPLDLIEEFENIGELNEDGSNEEDLLRLWKGKRKHFIILSAAGKPIYTRHGDTGLISGYVGIIQTIISFYQESSNQLRNFTAGDTKFAVLSQNNLFLVAITRFQESEAQLRVQLDALYMQILSTLTLPTLERIFSTRPSSDLRRPLQGTEVLLSSLADSFTRGSPSTLLSALECLKLRKSHRQAINNTLLKCRAEELLYGLIVAGGRLVSVVRPKKHSLHPSDLQLIFNMIFEADGIKAGGGESWIPICLPGFNSKGYLHMYVHFLGPDDTQSPPTTATPKATTDEKLSSSQNSTPGSQSPPSDDTPRNTTNPPLSKDSSVAIILISPSSSAFESLQSMRVSLISSLTSQKGALATPSLTTNPSMDHPTNLLSLITHTTLLPRPTSTDIIPGSPLLHFLYKSRPNVQFVMPRFPSHNPETSRRTLLTTYSTLHTSLHAKHAHIKIQHCVNTRHGTALGWMTPMFELYAVAGRTTSRSALAHGANKIVQWVQKEEERLFIIGGAVF